MIHFILDKRRNKTVKMTDQSELGSPGNYLDIIKEACRFTCEPDSHSNWILNEIKDQIKENAKSNDERKFFTRLIYHTTPNYIPHPRKKRYFVVHGLKCTFICTFMKEIF